MYYICVLLYMFPYCMSSTLRHPTNVKVLNQSWRKQFCISRAAKNKSLTMTMKSKYNTSYPTCFNVICNISLSGGTK